MSDYNFIRFIRKGSKFGNYSISINKSDSFGFNSGFYSKEEIKKFKRVILFFDKSKNAVAFQFTNDDNAEGSYAVTHGKNSGSVSAHSFFLEHNLKQDQFLGRKIPKKEKDDRLPILYFIDLVKKE